MSVRIRKRFGSCLKNDHWKLKDPKINKFSEGKMVQKIRMRIKFFFVPEKDEIESRIKSDEKILFQQKYFLM